MRLVPRQLQRAGMTGEVPYYGGRMTPGQARAATHQGSAAASTDPPGQRSAGDLTRRLESIQQLLDDGVIDQAEYQSLRDRILS